MSFGLPFRFYTNKMFLIIYELIIQSAFSSLKSAMESPEQGEVFSRLARKTPER